MEGKQRTTCEFSFCETSPYKTNLFCDKHERQICINYKFVSDKMKKEVKEKD